MPSADRSDLSGPNASRLISVAIGQWAAAAAPARMRTLLGSCVGVVLHDRGSQVGAMAHIVLPDSRGNADHPGKFADTAIPGMIAELDRLLQSQHRSRGRLVAKLFGGASMFGAGTIAPGALNVGQMNQDATERILQALRIPILARDLGGASGRHLTFDVASGMVAIKIPGGADYEL